MGAENKNISLNLLIILIKKILPGSIFAIFFIESTSAISLRSMTENYNDLDS